MIYKLLKFMYDIVHPVKRRVCRCCMNMFQTRDTDQRVCDWCMFAVNRRVG